MDDERLDLSALDPMHDPERWRSFAAATMSRVDGVLLDRRARADDPLFLIAAWRKPLLAAAAILLAALIPAEVALEMRESRLEAAHRLAVVSVEWVESARTPSGAEILSTIAERGTQ